MHISSPSPSPSVVVLGADPLGLATAYALTQRGLRPWIIEPSAHIGGNVRTEEYKGYRFDIDDHRLFTRTRATAAMWHDTLGGDFSETPLRTRTLQRARPYHPLLEPWTAVTTSRPLRALNRLRRHSNSAARPAARWYRHPDAGVGQLADRLVERICERGGRLDLRTNVRALIRRGSHIHRVVVQRSDRTWEIPVAEVFSRLPLNELTDRLEPAPPLNVRVAAYRLRYQHVILVGLILNRRDVFPEHYLTVRNPHVRVVRIHNYGNWSPTMLADQSTTSLGLEYVTTPGDDLWARSDADLMLRAHRELTQLGLARATEVLDGVVFHRCRVTPVYDDAYRGRIAMVCRHLARIENLHALERYRQIDPLVARTAAAGPQSVIPTETAPSSPTPPAPATIPVAA